MRESTRDRLHRVPLFAELEEVDLDRLAGLSRILILRRKETVFREGEPYEGMFVILEGLAVVFKLSEDGRMLILHVCRPGDSFAEVALFDGQDATYAAHARVTRDSEILFLPKDQFAPFLKQHPEVAWEMLKGFAGRLKELTAQLEGVTLREVAARLASYLLREAEAEGSSFTLPLAKSSLASYLGTVHETLSRTFARLIKEEIVSVEGSRVTILDSARLQRLVK